ncbi:MAG: twin-arginine translocase TatA/TatE family subunit [Actinomycetota bacterium]
MSRFVAFPSVGWPELLIVLVVLLLLFGARRLPEIARSLGKSTKEFKAGVKEGVSDEDETEDEEAETKKSAE